MVTRDGTYLTSIWRRALMRSSCSPDLQCGKLTLTLRYHPTSFRPFIPTSNCIKWMNNIAQLIIRDGFSTTRNSHHVDFTTILCSASRYLCSSAIHRQKAQELSTRTSYTACAREHPLGSFAQPPWAPVLTIADAQARCPSTIPQVGRRVWTRLQPDPGNQALHRPVQRSSCQGPS